MSRRTLAALLVALVALPVACSSGDDGGGGSAAPGSGGDDATTTTEPPRWPLTNLSGADAAGLDRPFLWVKIDNAPAARPQTGLDKADVVIEEMVEGGLTRFMAVYHSTGSDPIGPVRSVRPVDADIVAPYGGLFAYSGGAKKYADLLHTTTVQDVGADRAGDLYFRDRTRRAPNNQFARTSELLAAGKGDQPPAEALFEYVADVDAFPGDGIDAGPITTLRVDLPRVSIGFRWDAASRKWLRETDGKPHLTTAGDPLSFDNVILQFTPYTASTDKDAGGHDVPLAEPIGTNRAWFMANNRVYEGEWSKPSRTTPIRYTTKTGDDARLVPGRTMVVLVPTQNVPVTS